MNVNIKDQVWRNEGTFLDLELPDFELDVELKLTRSAERKQQELRQLFSSYNNQRARASSMLMTQDWQNYTRKI